MRSIIVLALTTCVARSPLSIFGDYTANPVNNSTGEPSDDRMSQNVWSSEPLPQPCQSTCGASLLEHSGSLVELMHLSASTGLPLSIFSSFSFAFARETKQSHMVSLQLFCADVCR